MKGSVWPEKGLWTEQSGGFGAPPPHYPGSTAPFKRSLSSTHKRWSFFLLQFLEEHIHTGLEKVEAQFFPHQICVKASAIGWRGSHPSIPALMHQQSLGEPLRLLGACVDLNASGGNKLGL